jgi:hypothetical protein
MNCLPDKRSPGELGTARGGARRPRHFGESDYEQSEKFIQKLLAEGGATGISQELVAVYGRGVEATAEWRTLKSPENYVGFERTEHFASPGGADFGKPRVYAASAHLKLNHWALSGDWSVQRQASVLHKPNERIVYRFRARNLH